jgi:hypothetical protein
MGEQWYFARDGKRMGPFSFEQLQQMAASGIVVADDMLLRVGELQWSPARSVDALFAVASSDAVMVAPAKPQAIQPVPMEGLAPPIAAASGHVAGNQPQDGTPPSISTASLPPIPAIVRAAGIIWIVFGCLVLPFVLLMSEPASMFLVAVFAAAFIFVGAQTASGRARDVIGNGIGSLVFGFSAISGGATMLPMGAVLSVVGLPLFAAGVCALIGRNDYKKWRREKERGELIT